MSGFFMILTSLMFMFFVVLLMSKMFIQKSSKNEPSKTLNINQLGKIQLWLNSANVRLSSLQFIVMTTTFIVLSSSVVYTFSKTPLISFVIGASFGLIPYSLISKKRLEKTRELMYAWPDALRDVSAHISSGDSLVKGLSALASDETSPLSSYMLRFSSLEKTLGFAGALEIVRGEMNDATSDRIIEVLILAHDRGGRIVKDIIDDLIQSTMQDIAVAESIQSESVEMKINSRAVVIIPWFVLFMLTLSDGAFRSFYQSKSGTLIIGIGAILTLVGVLILNRLARIEVEPRVFIEQGA